MKGEPRVDTIFVEFVVAREFADELPDFEVAVADAALVLSLRGRERVDTSEGVKDFE